jgi:hypothetical protein
MLDAPISGRFNRRHHGCANDKGGLAPNCRVLSQAAVPLPRWIDASGVPVDGCSGRARQFGPRLKSVPSLMIALNAVNLPAQP